MLCIHISCKINWQYITHLLTGVWRCPKRSRLLQGRMPCTVHIPVVKRPARKMQVLIGNNGVIISFFEVFRNYFSQSMLEKNMQYLVALPLVQCWCLKQCHPAAILWCCSSSSIQWLEERKELHSLHDSYHNYNKNTICWIFLHHMFRSICYLNNNIFKRACNKIPYFSLL